MPGPVPPIPDEARLLEHTEVLRDGRPGHGQVASDLANRLGALERVHTIVSNVHRYGSPEQRLGVLLHAFIQVIPGAQRGAIYLSVPVAHTYVACLFIIIALSSRATGTWLLRAQVVILYAGAALNKTLDVDWWNGRYFDAFLVDHHANPVYLQAASMLPAGLLSTVMGILTIVTQWILVATFVRPSSTPVGIAIGLVFHGAMVVLLNNTFGPFMLALFATYVGLGWSDRAAGTVTGGTGRTSRAAWLWHQPAFLFLLTTLMASAAFSGWLRNATMIAAAASLWLAARGSSST